MVTMRRSRRLERCLPWLAGCLIVLGSIHAEEPEATGDGTRRDEAEERLLERLTENPQHVPHYQALAEIYAARGDVGEAVDLLLEVGDKLLLAARAKEARPPLELAVELAPERAEAHALLGRTLAELRQFGAAAGALERAVELGDRRVKTLLFLASSLWESERYEEAEGVYRQAVEKRPDLALGHFQLGQFLLFRGRASDALTSLERANALRPDTAEIVFFLARAKAETGHVAAAIQAFERVIALDSASDHARRARHNLAVLRQRRSSLPPAPEGLRKEVGHPPSKLVLTPIADAAGLDFRHDPGRTSERRLPETMGAGLAWLDFDGDGWTDLYLVQTASSSRLFRNLGGAVPHFVDVSARAGIDVGAGGQGAAAADTDGDGDLDLLQTGLRTLHLENRGDGTFRDVTGQRGPHVDGWSSSAAFADADGDGDLDVYITRYLEPDADAGAPCENAATGEREYCNVIFFPGVSDLFFLQSPGGRFVDATASAGLGEPGRGLGVVFQDLDGDHRPDLYVANDLDPNHLYRRLPGADVVFEDVSMISGAAFNREGQGEAGMGLAAGDVDGAVSQDRLPELLVTNFDVETNTLYRNLGELAFDDVSAASGFGLPSFRRLGFGIVLEDLDLDGALDVYVANGHVFENPRREGIDHAQADLFLLGDDRGGFTAYEPPPEAPSLPAGVGRGVATADLDLDGDPDLAVQQNGGTVELLRNERQGRRDRAGAEERWLTVELHGAEKNSRAVGARLTLVTAVDGGERRRTRWVTVGGSYQSSSAPRLFFAWPEGETLEELEVLWPSGRRSRLRGVLPARRHLHLR